MARLILPQAPVKRRSRLKPGAPRSDPALALRVPAARASAAEAERLRCLAAFGRIWAETATGAARGCAAPNRAP